MGASYVVEWFLSFIHFYAIGGMKMFNEIDRFVNWVRRRGCAEILLTELVPTPSFFSRPNAFPPRMF